MRKAILIVAILSGVLAAVGSLGLAVGLGVLALVRPEALGEGSLITATLAVAAGVIGAGLGVTLAWQGGRALIGAPGGVMRLPRWGWWAGALILALAAGQAALLLDARWAMPILHVAASVAPAGLLLALALGSARRSGGAMPTRSLLGGLSWGIFGGVGIALVLELLAGLVVIVAAIAWIAVAQPEWAAQFENLAGQPSLAAGELDPDMLAALLRSPVVWLGVLGLGSGVVPLIEEIAKSLAVPLVALTGRRLTRLDGFLLGVAAGAGFAIFEGVGNGGMALAASESWATLMLVRGGATAMHCLASGLTGLAWQSALTERRLARGLGLVVLAMTLHGIWNAAALGASAVSLLSATVDSGARLLSGAAVIVLLAGVGVLAVGAVLAVALVPRRLVHVQAPASTPDATGIYEEESR